MLVVNYAMNNYTELQRSCDLFNLTPEVVAEHVLHVLICGSYCEEHKERARHLHSSEFPSLLGRKCLCK